MNNQRDNHKLRANTNYIKPHANQLHSTKMLLLMDQQIGWILVSPWKCIPRISTEESDGRHQCASEICQSLSCEVTPAAV